MRLSRIIVGLIFLCIGLYFLYPWVGNVGIRSFFLPPLLFFFIFIAFLFFSKISIFSLLSVFFGIIALHIGWLFSKGAFPWQSSSIDSLALVTLFVIFPVGLLTILPTRFYKKSFIKGLSYFFASVLILIFLTVVGYYSWELSTGSIDFLLPLYVWGVPLLAGIFCLPFLIKKAKSI